MRGAAFGSAADGNGLNDGRALRRISAELGIPGRWAHLRQVHGAVIRWAGDGGQHGDGDGLATAIAGVPLAVATADCFPVVIEADGAVGVAHAGWRGAAAGVVAALRRTLEESGAVPLRAAVGPGIGPCCYEVGPEVAARFADHGAATSRGAPSVDLAAAIVADLAGLEVWTSGVCTHCDPAYHSHRRDGTDDRQIALAWLPST
jgi:YfiH family protein